MGGGGEGEDGLHGVADLHLPPLLPLPSPRDALAPVGHCVFPEEMALLLGEEEDVRGSHHRIAESVGRGEVVGGGVFGCIELGVDGGVEGGEALLV